jgi:hypothetical protein
VRFPFRLRQDLAGLKRDLASLIRDRRLWVLVLWVAPTLAYYALIHMGQQGLVFVFLPALLLLSAASLVDLLQPASWQSQTVLAGIVAANALVFLAAPTYPMGGSVKILTLDTLRTHDRSHMALLQGIEANFDSQHTFILASWWRFPQYYLRDYPLIHFDVGARWELDEGQGSIAAQTLDQARLLGLEQDKNGNLIIDPAALGLLPDSDGYYYLLIFDEHLSGMNLTPERQERLELAPGGRLAYLRLKPQERFYLGNESFEVVAADNISFKR